MLNPRIHIPIFWFCQISVSPHRIPWPRAHASQVLSHLDYIQHLQLSNPLVTELQAIECPIDYAKSEVKNLQARVGDGIDKLQNLRTPCAEKMTEIEKINWNLVVGFIGDDLLSGPWDTNFHGLVVTSTLETFLDALIYILSVKVFIMFKVSRLFTFFTQLFLVLNSSIHARYITFSEAIYRIFLYKFFDIPSPRTQGQEFVEFCC